MAKPLVAGLSTKIVPLDQRLRMLFYRAALPLSQQTLTFVSGLIRTHRKQLGSVWRKLNSGRQALVLGDLPGSTHDTAAARIWQILAALRDAGIIALGDKGYHGHDETGQHVITPYKGKNKPESQKDANRAHARLRGPGERANAQLKAWDILRKLRSCPRRAGQLAKAIHVLQNYETTAG